MQKWCFRIQRHILRSLPQLIVLFAFLVLAVSVMLVAHSHNVEKRMLLCEPCVDRMRPVAIHDDKLDVVGNATGQTMKRNTVAGNVLKKKGGNITSIFAEGAGYYRFKNILDISLNDTLNERASWSLDKWNNETVNILKNNIEDDVVIIALSNFGMKEMTMNWIASLKHNNYKKFVVLCFDFAMYRFLTEHGLERNAALIPSSWYNMTLETDFVQWGDDRYLAMLHGKLLVILELLKRGFTILHSDVDIVFLNPYVVKHLLGEDRDINSDFIYMVDESNKEGDVINGGFWLARPTQLMQDVWNRTHFLSTTQRRFRIDQMALNHIVHRERPELRYSRHFSPMSRSLYPSGKYLKPKKYVMNQDLRIYPMVAHVNWRIGIESKKRLLKEMKMWYVGEDFAPQLV